MLMHLSFILYRMKCYMLSDMEMELGSFALQQHIKDINSNGNAASKQSVCDSGYWMDLKYTIRQRDMEAGRDLPSWFNCLLSAPLFSSG